MFEYLQRMTHTHTYFADDWDDGDNDVSEDNDDDDSDDSAAFLKQCFGFKLVSSHL